MSIYNLLYLFIKCTLFTYLISLDKETQVLTATAHNWNILKQDVIIQIHADGPLSRGAYDQGKISVQW